MKYYLEISSWNLLESFVTESISPFFFYKERNFGNNLSRYLGSKSEKINFLILSEKDQGGDYTIEIDESLLDTNCLKLIKGLTSTYTYNKTIFYKKGMVRFRFDNSDLKDALIAESQILFEVKCIDKYKGDFYCAPVKKKAEKVTIQKLGESFSFEMANYIANDNRYNAVKGAIVGYARGAMTMSNPESQKLIAMVRDIKNDFAGLNTQIMVNESKINNPEHYIYAIQQCKYLYHRVNVEKTNLFDILLHQFSSIQSMATDRAKELASYKSRSHGDSQSSLIEEKRRLEEEIMEIELSSNLSNLKKELAYIKNQEVENGKKVGKSRVYFKQDTPEYARKQELKEEIKKFEEENCEYKHLRASLNDVNQRMMNAQMGKSSMDDTIASVFARVSDITMELQKKVSAAATQDSISLNSIEYSLEDGMQLLQRNNAENEYFNVLLNLLLDRDYKENISEALIMNIIEVSCNNFKSCESYNTTDGQRIISCLREYWKYKNQKAMRFDIPDDMPILQAIMSFFIKPFGFDQIERYMLNKKFSYKSHAFMLWGASRGFADLPKTFTNIIYENNQTTLLVEEKLCDIAGIINQ